MKIINALIIAGVAATSSLYASTVTLDFEGITTGLAATPVNCFYCGVGADFSVNPTATVRQQAPTGSGNYGGLPSGVAALDFAAGNAAVLDVASGFDGTLSFWYSSPNDAAGSVTIYSSTNGVFGDGNVITSVSLPQTALNGGGGGCPGPNPGADYCPFVFVSVTFGGTAFSADFAGTNSQIAFDDITFTQHVTACTVDCGGGGGDTPEPGTMFLLGSSLVGLGFGARKFKLKKS